MLPWRLRDNNKMELTREHFRAMIFYDFRRGLSRQECIDQLTSTFGDEAPSFATVKRWYNEFNAGITNLIVAAIRSPTRFAKVVQNQLLFKKTLMLCKT